MTYPFFVYGTLRPGHGNQRCWITDAVAEHDGEARLLGYRLLGADHWFPYAVATGQAAHVTVGAIIRPVPGAYDTVLARLDALEGYPSHYDRVPAEVRTPDGPVTCWVYTPTGDDLWARRVARLAPVPGGDWSAWCAGRGGAGVPATW